MKKFFDTQDRYIPSKTELEQSKIIYTKCKELGIPQGIFSNSNIYTKEELLALKYIHSNKDITKDLEEFLIKTKDERLDRLSKPVSIVPPTDDEIVEYLTDL